jgi:hypothetical protein
VFATNAAPPHHVIYGKSRLMPRTLPKVMSTCRRFAPVTRNGEIKYSIYYLRSGRYNVAGKNDENKVLPEREDICAASIKLLEEGGRSNFCATKSKRQSITEMNTPMEIL